MRANSGAQEVNGGVLGPGGGTLEVSSGVLM